MSTIPPSRPKLSKNDALAYITPFLPALEQYPVRLIGIRGYYRDSMGTVGVNDIGIYDDAICIVSPTIFKAFNANTDPSRHGLGIATLVTTEENGGVPYFYEKGIHGIHHLDVVHNAQDRATKSQLLITGKDVPKVPLTYWALRQHGRVTVLRDGKKETDTAAAPFWVDNHRGGINTTSSLSCQTIPPEQWEEYFWNTVLPEMAKYGQKVIPYCLSNFKG
jgi:lysozyme